MLEAFREVLDSYPGAELVLAGDGEMRDAVERRIRDLGLQAHVRITGWISGGEVRRQILDARALVLPSFQEGLPVALMEAMALGRPVISTFVAGIPELVTPDAGWLVPAGDATALAEAMRACLRASAEELERKGQAGAHRVAQQHNVEEQAALLAALFRRSLARGQTS